MKRAGSHFQGHDFLAWRPIAPLSRAVAALGWGPRDSHAPGRPRMTIQAKLLCAVAVTGFAVFAAMPAQALSMSECSAKYKEAKTAGTLNGQKWADFRKPQCGTDAAAPAAAPAPAAAAPAPAAPKAAE